jgi:putative membrane protein
VQHIKTTFNSKLKNLKMKTIKSGVLIMASALVFASCGGDKTKTDTTSNVTTSSDSLAGNTMMADTTTTQQVTTTPDLAGTAGPTNFTFAAANGGMMEVEAAKLAQQKASSKEVKELATMILNDHTKANAELKKVAASKNISVPSTMTGEHQSHIDMLRAKSGGDFDNAYLKMMDEDHAKDIEMFREASATLPDADLKAFASKSLPVLQKHQDKVKSLLSKM